MTKPTRIIIMGVSGCGESAVGAALAKVLGGRYVDGDDMHRPTSIAKMQAGAPLEDPDRWPWLDRVGQTLAKGENVTIIACSALKRIYRDRIRDHANGQLLLVHLSGTRGIIAGRMATRPDHYMSTSLLESQFATLEPPTADECSITVASDKPLKSVVAGVKTLISALEPCSHRLQ